MSQISDSNVVAGLGYVCVQCERTFPAINPSADRQLVRLTWLDVSWLHLYRARFMSILTAQMDGCVTEATATMCRLLFKRTDVLVHILRARFQDSLALLEAYSLIIGKRLEVTSENFCIVHKLRAIRKMAASLSINITRSN